jgi:small basic protein (TIGR04137 family)
VFSVVFQVLRNPRNLVQAVQARRLYYGLGRSGVESPLAAPYTAPFDIESQEGQLFMTIDRSLRVRAGSLGNRSVLTRGERLEKLKESDRWREGESVFGLPKVRVVRTALKKKKKAKAEEAAEGAAEGEAAPAAGAASAAGAAGKAPAAAAKPTAGKAAGGKGK